MRERIRDLRAVFDFTKRKRPYVPDAETIAKYPPVDHPMVRRHPRTGRLGLYVMKVDSTSVVGMEQEDARRLIDALSDHIIKPRFVYRPFELDPTELKRKLFSIPIEKVEEPTFYKIFLDLAEFTWPSYVIVS